MKNVCWIIFILFSMSISGYAQTQDAHPLTIKIRDIQGNPMKGIKVEMFNLATFDVVLPEYCLTDEDGICTWYSGGNSVYQAKLPDYRLDPITAAAIGEAGGTGIGFTVGNTGIEVGVVLTDDSGFYYHDMAKDEPIPEPFIPQEADVMTHQQVHEVVATANSEEGTRVFATVESVEAEFEKVGSEDSTNTDDELVENEPRPVTLSLLIILLAIGLAIVLAVVLARLFPKKNTKEEEDDDAIVS